MLQLEGIRTPFFGLFVAVAFSCGDGGSDTTTGATESESDPNASNTTDEGGTETTTAADTTAGADIVAAVTDVTVEGEPGAYTFDVTLSSPDTGCEQWADWWEVVSVDGSQLYYRRILTHSHVDEQPFTRSGSPVPIEEGASFVVRAHMFPAGYGEGEVGWSGTVGGGERIVLDADFGAALETEPPLPESCAF